jgi:tetratricopeptide (TPR) repeat protein
MWTQESQFSALFSNGQWEQAESLALASLGTLGDSEGWLVRHALCCIALGRFAEALQSLDRAVCVEPRSLEALLTGSVVLADLGFYEEASKRFEAAVALARDEGMGPWSELDRKHRELALAHLRAGDVRGALALATNAVSLRDSAAGRTLLAAILLRSGEPAGALEELERARRLDPHDSHLQVLASVCFLQLGREGEARDALVRAETLQDRSRAGHVLRRAILSNH